MPIPALAIAGGAALANFLGGLFGGKSKEKHEKERATEQDAAARRAWDQNEQLRIGRLKSLMSTASARGINVGTLDPSLLVPRPYPGPNSTAGMGGPSFWGNALNFVGDVGMGYAQSADPEMAGPPGSMISSGGSTSDPIVEGLLEAQRQKSGLMPSGQPGGFGGDDQYGPWI